MLSIDLQSRLGCVGPGMFALHIFEQIGVPAYRLLFEETVLILGET
jgi:hypothetical protein